MTGIFDYFAIEEQASAFDDHAGEGFGALVALWQAKRSGAVMPSWEDFTLNDFEGWHASMALSEVLPERADIRFRYFGSDMVAMQGKDMTGEILSESLPSAYNKTYQDHFRQFLHEPTLAVGRLPAASDKLKDMMVVMLHLPLSSCGTKIDRVLHFARRLPSRL